VARIEPGRRLLRQRARQPALIHLDDRQVHIGRIGGNGVRYPVALADAPAKHVVPVGDRTQRRPESRYVKLAMQPFGEDHVVRGAVGRELVEEPQSALRGRERGRMTEAHLRPGQRGCRGDPGGETGEGTAGKHVLHGDVAAEPVT
jgi:hypothetical protein